MSKKGLYSPVIRKLVTIIVLTGILGSFLGVYYLVYLPQTRMLYNARNFRILHEISNNFKQRVETYGTLYGGSYLSQLEKDPAIDTSFLNAPANDSAANQKFLSSFRGNPENSNLFTSQPSLLQDSIRFSLCQTQYDSTSLIPVKKKINFDTTIALKSFLEPIITVHSQTFESVLLIKKSSVTDPNGKITSYDSILYKSDNTDIVNIKTDSLFKNPNVQAPIISDLDIEGISYKLFLLPFKINSKSADTYVLAGVVSGKTYKQESQDIPVDLLLTVCVILIILLLALPFLKIFFLSAEESITFRDIRTIILTIYIIPVFIVLVCSFIWLSLYKDKQVTGTLQNLQKKVQENWYNEIGKIVLQTKDYDSIITHASTAVDRSTKNSLRSHIVPAVNTTDVKDVIFYPKKYENLTSLHWMNNDGNDIAAWSFGKLPATYFKLGDRPYFTDIKYKRGYTLADTTNGADSIRYSIQPVLSRLTGEYTVNIAVASSVQILPENRRKKAVAVGLSAKMYSIWNTVVPKGFAFCIVDENGVIVCHTDTARNLQENIFQESGDSLRLQTIMNHKDSALLTDINLYDHPVRMILKPMPGLPYYLITYYNKRGEYLFLFHIIAFVFVCESVLLMLISLFSYLMMINDKKISKLLFTSSNYDWLKPSADKKNYYIKIILQSLATVLFILLFSVFYNGDDYFLYSLNIAILLPLFTLTGYYITKKSRDFIIKEKIKTTFFTKSQYEKFALSILKIVLLYILAVALFFIFQTILFYNKSWADIDYINNGIRMLVVLVPLAIIMLSGINWNYHNQQTSNKKQDNHYLTYFIISLLFSVTLISVVPAITFVSYAFREEKMLQVQSSQIDLAKQIQERRKGLNSTIWKTKLATNPFQNKAAEYLHQLKFTTTKGIYLNDTNRVQIFKNFDTTQHKTISCSPFYKIVTQYLFLPPDHDEFYDGPTHNNYYYWYSSIHKNSNDTIRLFYKNTTDYMDSSNFYLTSALPHIRLFSGFTADYQGLLVLLILIILFFLFYKVISSTTKRVFLIGFLKNPDKQYQESQWLQDCHKNINLKEKCGELFKNNNVVNFKTIRNYEDAEIIEQSDAEDRIIQLQLDLLDIYESIWQKLTDNEKYTLYDFATDGFTNYKQALMLYDLQRKGLIIKEPDGNITIMTKSFRNFLITKGTTEEVKRMSNEGKKGSWGTLRTVFYIILIAVAIFIFISQEEASKRLITIVTSLGALLPAILKLFDKGTFGAPAAAKTDAK